MKKNRSYLVIILAAFLCSFFLISAEAKDKATKKECMAKTKQAARMINEKGLDAVLKKINDKKGPFVWKDSYVFCLEEDTVKLIGHPFFNPKWREMSQKGYRDANGKLVFQEFIKIVNESGEGWVEYMYVRKPGEEPRKKTSYIYKVKGTNVIVGAGIYE